MLGAQVRESTVGKVPLGVVIPTYQRPEALVECLRHLEAQTWKAFEVIVVDDGSADDTRAVVEAYRAQTALRLRYLRQENAGPARARNYAVSQLEAEVCVLIGDDIFASPEFVERHLEFHW
jgi:glycosyltransferase involved in cell wall biosynthesis